MDIEGQPPISTAAHDEHSQMVRKIGRGMAALKNRSQDEIHDSDAVAGGRLQLTQRQVDVIESRATAEASSAPNAKSRRAVHEATKHLLEMRVVGIDPHVKTL